MDIGRPATEPGTTRRRVGRRVRLIAFGSVWAIVLTAVGLGTLLARAPAEPVLASGGIARADPSIS